MTLGSLIVAVLGALLILAPPAIANPDDVIIDYRADGVIDGEHDPDALWDSLERWLATGTPNDGSFEEAVTEALDRLTLGIAARTPPSRPPTGVQSSNEVVPQATEQARAFALPEPPPPQGDSRPPVAFMALSALAALLVLAGAGAALTRRLRSRGS